MSRTGVNATEAFARLRTMSQSQSVKLTDVARGLLGEAVRNARAHHTAEDPGTHSD